MKAVRILFICHLFALAFGLAGLLIILPHPELWADNQAIVTALPYALQYTGSTHILFGAATMLAFGLVYLGKRKTLTFFAIATLLPLGMELLGTGTGFPFGAYAYTDNLGYKIMGRVPFSIPLSWFYMGFTAYLLAHAIIGAAKKPRPAWWSIALGAYLLTAWDLALDPAMASKNLVMRFWVWHVQGLYFGMPLRNFAGWCATGILFMTLSRLAWREGLKPRQYPTWLPFGVYAANMVFAMILSLGAGLWQPPLIALTLGLVPAFIAWRTQAPRSTDGSSTVRDPLDLVLAFLTRRTLADGAKGIAATRLRLSVEGREYLPQHGPVVFAARHYHHFYDGCVLLATVRRPLHILVALDWTRTHLSRAIMEIACHLAHWPVILRTDAPLADAGEKRAYREEEATAYLRRATRQAVHLLRAGKALVIFPEGYPNIDPGFTLKDAAHEYLPFKPGFVRMVEIAQRDGATSVPIVPVGFAYTPGRRWSVTLRFGEPLLLGPGADRAAFLREVEARVRELSRPVTVRAAAGACAARTAFQPAGEGNG